MKINSFASFFFFSSLPPFPSLLSIHSFFLFISLTYFLLPPPIFFGSFLVLSFLNLSFYLSFSLFSFISLSYFFPSSSLHSFPLTSSFSSSSLRIFLLSLSLHSFPSILPSLPFSSFLLSLLPSQPFSIFFSFPFLSSFPSSLPLLLSHLFSPYSSTAFAFGPPTYPPPPPLHPPEIAHLTVT